MDNYFEHVQDYLEGTLTSEENTLFEQELETNTELRNAVEQQRQLRQILQKHIEADIHIPALRYSIQQAQTTYSTQDKPVSRTRVITWLAPIAVAACLLVALNFSGFFSTDFDRLPEMTGAVSRGESTADTFDAASKAFNDGNYESSIVILTSLLADDTTSTRHRYYLGLSYLGSADYKQAIVHLQPIADGQSVFADEAKYFTALAFWRSKKTDHARAYAQAVSLESTYRDKADKMLKKLR